MRALTGEDFLKAWEFRHALREQEAVLAVLDIGFPERSRAELARLPLAERNTLLLELRAATLGRRMDGFAVCPDCGAQLEFVLDPLEMANARDDPPSGEFHQSARHMMRAVDSMDMLASAAAADERQARLILLARTLGVDEAEAEKAEQCVLDQFERVNSAAEIRLQLQCGECRGSAGFDFDVAGFFLRELSSAARRLAQDIHELASAYGWSERSIAAMSVMRRTAYLELLSP
jgi:hypothetical protein